MTTINTINNYKSQNCILSTTKELSGAENTLYFNPSFLIPHEWVNTITNNSGRAEYLAIFLLSDIVGWIRTYRTNKKVKYSGNVPYILYGSLCTQYEYFQDKLNASKERLRKAFVLLEKLNCLRRETKNILTEDGKYINKVLIHINEDFFNSCFRDSELDIRAKTSGNKATLKGGSTSLETHAQNQGYLLRNKNLKNKDRSMKSIFENKFLEKERNEEEGEGVELQNINHSNDSQEKKEDNTHPITKNSTHSDTNPSLASKVKAIFCREPKGLKDFYPLGEEDCYLLKKTSGRDFTLNAMNEILLDMSKRLTNPTFYSKKGFIAYMSKAFIYEKRDAVVTSNENFKIKANITNSEKESEIQEKYLTELEYSLQVSPEWHLKKKLASVFERSKAYKLLTSYKSIDVRGGEAKIYLSYYVELSPADHDLILSQIQATHQDLGDVGQNNRIDRVLIEMPDALTGNRISNPMTSNPIRTGAWGAIRTIFVNYFGDKGDGLDSSWLSRLEATFDETTKSLKLKAPSEFYKDYVSQHFLPELTRATSQSGFKLISIEC